MAPSNTLPMHGNEKTMNLNSLVLTNIQSSPYFKVQLYELKTYHQVIDEIYYKVNHLEPWEKGSRKTAGQTGMCGGVRGVGTGGIVSSAFCLLYKLHTMKLTRKQLIGLCNHTDSPYIRALGFMYIRFTQPSSDLWEWFEPYLEDEEELDVKAGGGHVMTIGDMAEHFLTKLDWYSTLFPRIAVPVQKQIEQGLRQHKANKWRNVAAAATAAATAASAATTVDNSVEHPDSYSRANDRNYTGTERTDERDVKRRPDPELESRSSDRHSGRRGSRHRSRSPRRSRSRGCSSRERHHNSHSHRSHEGHRSQEGDRSHSRNQHRRSPPSDRRRSMSRDRSYSRRDKQENSRHRSDRRRTPSGESRGTSHKTEGSHHSRNRHNEPEDDFDRELRKEMERIKHEKGIKASGGQQ